MKNLNNVASGLTHRKLMHATVAAAALFATGVQSAHATFIRDPVTLDRTSPSVIGNGPGGTVRPSDILSVVSNPGSGAPVVHIAGPDYGVGAFDTLTSSDNTLDISSGEADDTAVQVFHFTVSRSSTGIGGTDVNQQANLGHVAGDRFIASPSLSPRAVWNAFKSTGENSPSPADGHSLPFDGNQTFYNLQDDDNADSLEVRSLKFDDEPGRTSPVYFVLDTDSPTLSANDFKTSDILLSPDDGNQTFGLFVEGGFLGLTDSDVVDGLAVWDADGIADTTNSTDLVLFSLAPGSPFLSDVDEDGIPLFTPATVFVSDLSGQSTVFLTHMDLGLNLGDDIDGLDVIPIPEPASLALLALPAIAMLRRRARRA